MRRNEHTLRGVIGLALLVLAAAGSGAARADSAAGVFVQTTALRGTSRSLLNAPERRP